MCAVTVCQGLLIFWPPVDMVAPEAWHTTRRPDTLTLTGSAPFVRLHGHGLPIRRTATEQLSVKALDGLESSC